MSCAICIEQFQQSREPKVLRCGHSFCLVCLGGWVQSQRSPGRGVAVQCPVCKQDTPLQSGHGADGVASLPTNFALLDAIEVDSTPLCDDDASSSLRTCPVHTGTPLEYACITCSGVLVCRQCVKSKHRREAGHRISSLLSLVQQEQAERAELQKLVSELQKRNIELTEDNAVLQLDKLERVDSRGVRSNSLPSAQRNATEGRVVCKTEETGGAKDTSAIHKAQTRSRPVSGNLAQRDTIANRQQAPPPPLAKSKSLPPSRFRLPPPPRPQSADNQLEPPPLPSSIATKGRPRSLYAPLSSQVQLRQPENVGVESINTSRPASAHGGTSRPIKTKAPPPPPGQSSGSASAQPSPQQARSQVSPPQSRTRPPPPPAPRPHARSPRPAPGQPSDSSTERPVVAPQHPQNEAGTDAARSESGEALQKLARVLQLSLNVRQTAPPQ